MKLIVGLGNPGKKYDGTRHNVGFAVVERVSRLLEIPLNQRKFRAQYGIEWIDGEKVCLMQPLTFMNLSGQAVGEFVRFYRISTEDVLLVYDDLDFPAGKIKLREKGSAGGHNGVRSVIDHLGTSRLKRIRVGIGRPRGNQDVIDYVLSPFSDQEEIFVRQAVEKAAKACAEWVDKPFPEVMNLYNRD